MEEKRPDMTSIGTILNTRTMSVDELAKSIPAEQLEAVRAGEVEYRERFVLSGLTTAKLQQFVNGRQKTVQAV